MKQRIFTGWNWMRAIYLVTGIIIMIQAVTSRLWVGLFLGGYFIIMAVFALGCAAGNCYGGSCGVKTIEEKKE
ncbi:MAG: hypothetical protein M9933_16625 [Chitinophagaceae bacterium]|nr:hypothetical protein [Chitinophagaceae bacterium]